jgi:hypothetical protein
MNNGKVIPDHTMLSNTSQQNCVYRQPELPIHFASQNTIWTLHEREDVYAGRGSSDTFPSSVDLAESVTQQDGSQHRHETKETKIAESQIPQRLSKWT